MAIARRQTTTQVRVDDSGTLSVTFPAALLPGSLVTIEASYYPGGDDGAATVDGVSAPWVAETANYGDVRTKLHTLRVPSAGPGVNVITFPSTGWGAIIAQEWTGVADPAPVYIGNREANGAIPDDAYVDYPDLDQSGCLIIALAGNNRSDGTGYWGAPDGYTLGLDICDWSGASSGASAYAVVESTAGARISWNVPPSPDGYANTAVIIFAPAAGAVEGDVGLSEESSSAQAPGGEKGAAVDLSEETSSPRALSGVKSAPVGLAVDTSTARVLGGVKSVLVGLATFVSDALELVGFKLKGVGLATTLEKVPGRVDPNARSIVLKLPAESRLFVVSRERRVVTVARENRIISPSKGQGSMYSVADKDPSDVLFYTFDWGAKWLGPNETIVSSTWTISGEDEELATPDGDEFEPFATETTTRICLGGGTDGKSYTVTNRITTSDGQQVERSFIIYVREQ